MQTTTTAAQGAALAQIPPTLFGPVIITRYLGPTDYKGSRVVATHQRDSGTKWRAVINWDDAIDSADNHQLAAEALLAKWPLGEGSEPFILIGRGHDHSAYYWLAIQPWQLDVLKCNLT